MSTLAHPDAVSQALDFLNLIHGQKPDELYCYVWYMERGRVGLSSFARDLAVLAERAARWSADGKDVYFGLGLSKTDNGPDRRITGPQCSGISCLWADIDIRGAAHAARNLPESEAVIRPLLDALPVRPSLVVHSGHGLHCYWLFRETWTLEGQAENRLAGAYQNALHAALGALSGVRGWALDKRVDLASVLRCCGTRNYKREPAADVRMLDWGTGLRHNPGDLEDHFLDVDTALKAMDQAAGAEDYAVDPNAKPLWNPQYWCSYYLNLAKKGVLSRHSAAIGLANQLRDDRQPVGAGREWMDVFRREAPAKDHEFTAKEAADVIKWAWSKPPRQQLMADAEPNAGIPEDLLDEAQTDDVENAPAVPLNGNGASNGHLGPIDWLNRQAPFWHRRIKIAKIVKVGRFLGDFDIILDDERRVCLGNAANVLSPAKVKAAFYDSLGVVLPPMKTAAWDKYAHQISAAAEVQDIAGDPAEEVMGWIAEFAGRMMNERVDLADREGVAEAIRKLSRPGITGIWTAKGELVVQIPRLAAWLSTQRYTSMTQGEIRKRLFRMGFRSERLDCRTEDGVKTRRVFISEKAFDQQL